MAEVVVAAEVAVQRRWDRFSEQARISILLGDRSGPFGYLGDDLDLRGLAIPPGTKIRKVALEHVDLSHARLVDAWIESSSFHFVRFDRAALVGVADHGNAFIRCSFLGTDFSRAVLGYEGSRYEECNFERPRLHRTGFVRPQFDDCIFSELRGKSTDFAASSFERCRFIGELSDVWFRGQFGYKGDEKRFGRPRPNRMYNVDFGQARLRDVHFSNGCPLDLVTPPTRETAVVVDKWPERLMRVKRRLQQEPPDVQSRADGFVEAHLAHARDQYHYLVVKEELFEEFGDDLGTMLFQAIT
ncbi:MAG: hypothetical protein CYG61_02070 [Actinobacteria bacterium]|nr:MAG: hypothetical protein CYG61_02070 [Actinomycetota bacterium]